MLQAMQTSSPSKLPSSLWVAWATSLLAVAASIYFIEILGKPAASLCWVNRMLMFGVLLILSTGIIRSDREVWRYTVPFLAVGLPVSFFQQLVHWNIIHVTPKACSLSYVCTTKFFNLFGFISQATLCLTAFTVVAVCMVMVRSRRD